VRQLHPAPIDPVDPERVYADLPTAPGRPGVRLNMIASVDGATAVDGKSGPLGGPPDRAIYRLLRSFADVVLVAAGTARIEDYRPARRYEEHLNARRARGQADVPRIAVVTRRLDLDWDSPLFRDAAEPTIVITPTDSDTDRLNLARTHAHLIAAGTGDVDLAAAVAELGALGALHVLAEGGPSLNGALAAAGLIDEVCLTISPTLAGGSAKRILAGPDLPPLALELRSLLEEDGFLMARYRAVRASDGVAGRD
jgi:riboflavin biosynthesis pyrimidine reductase